jgi:hypothetical protein
MLEADWIAQAAHFARQHPECGAFGGRVILDWQIPPPPWMLNYGYSFAEQQLGENPRRVSCLVGAGLIVNRLAIISSGWTDKQFLDDRIGEKLISGGDVEIALRIAAKYDLWYNPECKLKHFIPSARISNKYIIDINYGLGNSKFFGDATLWPGSFVTWLIAAFIQACRFSAGIICKVLRAIIGRTEMLEATINLSFLRGFVSGISNMLRMKSKDRQALLGCAARAVRRNKFKV